MRDDLLALNAAVRRIKDVKLQLAGLQKRTDAIGKGAARARRKELQGQLKEILGRLDTVLTQDLGALHKAVADEGIPPVVAVPFEK